MECDLESPGFSKFRALMDVWDEYLLTEEIRGQIESMIDSANHVLFFKYKKEIFGAGEDSRVAFARMKNPDDEMPKNWEDEASFTADNLNKAIRGEPGTQVFHKENLKEIKILDRDKAVEQLQKVAEKAGGVSVKKQVHMLDLSKLFHHDPDEAPNFVRADEE